jgi:hypothetical protein
MTVLWLGVAFGMGFVTGSLLMALIASRYVEYRERGMRRYEHEMKAWCAKLDEALTDASNLLQMNAADSHAIVLPFTGKPKETWH